MENIITVKRGLYTQLQYTTIQNAFESDWEDAVVQIEDPIYLRKKLSIWKIYFRARTMENEGLSKMKRSKQYLIAVDYHHGLLHYMQLIIYNKDGVSLTKSNIIIDINLLSFASYTGYLWEKIYPILLLLLYMGILPKATK